MSRLLKSLGVLMAGAIAIGGVTAPAAAQNKKVKIVVGGTSILNITYPWLNLPVALNYWKEEGYDVEVVGLAPPAQVVPLLISGDADFLQTSGGVIIQTNVMHNEQVRVAMQNTILDWAVGVPDTSPVRTIQDLKGKSVGVLSLATGGIAYFKTALTQTGMNPENDVRLIPVGFGAPAMDAIRSARVDGGLFWAAAFATFENNGMKLRYLRGADWRSYPDYSMAVLQKTIDRDPKMVEAIIRGSAKATLFAMTNPECVRQIQWKYFPATKPSGADDATLVKWDMNNLAAELDGMNDSHTINGGKLYGNVDVAGFKRLQDFLLATKQIEKTLPPENYMVNIPDFFQKVNNFNAAAVKAQAEKCSI